MVKLMPSVQDIMKAASDDYKKVIAQLTKDTQDDRNQQEYLDEYNGTRTRRSKSVGKRNDKTIKLYEEQKDETTGKVKKVQTGTKIIYVSRLIFDFPKKIVRTVTAFCAGGEMSVTSGNDSGDAFDYFKDKWEKRLKMKGIIKRFLRTVMIETKAAVLFYPVEKSGIATDLRVVLLNQDNGDFYPHFDSYGDMDAFTRKYDTTDEYGKPITIVEIYTEDKIYTYTKRDSEQYTKEEKKNLFKKIPVVYAEQSMPEWENVTALMDEFEMRVSRLADVNDYFSEPMLMLFGKPASLPDKDSIGKLIQFNLENQSAIDGKPFHGSAEYLTWDQTPESIKLELETLLDGIYSMSSTPNLNFDNMKGLGAVSGVALKLMFLDAALKASDKMEIFGPAIQRMVSVVKAGIGEIVEKKFKKQLEEDDIEVTFKSPLPDDVKEWIEMLGQAKNDRIISTGTAVDQNPLIQDKSKEKEAIKQEEATNAARQGDTMIGSLQ